MSISEVRSRLPLGKESNKLKMLLRSTANSVSGVTLPDTVSVDIC